MTEPADYQRPEGLLLKMAAERKKKSMRELAEDVGLSEARVRNIVNGYQAIGQGRRIEVRGPEDTVAKLAAVLQVTPEQLEEAGRPDAAHALRRRLPGGPMPQWAEGDETLIWRDAVATSEEIREWAEDPFNYSPPDAILEQFSTDSLLGELASRIAHGEREMGPYYWYRRPTYTDAMEPSEPDESLLIAALDVDPDVDEPAGGSQEGE